MHLSKSGTPTIGTEAPKTNPYRPEKARGLDPDDVRGTACSAQLKVGRQAVLAEVDASTSAYLRHMASRPQRVKRLFRRF
jgi:hypothetical protein